MLKVPRIGKRLCFRGVDGMIIRFGRDRIKLLSNCRLMQSKATPQLLSYPKTHSNHI